MAASDNIDVGVGTGTIKTVAADDIGGLLHQRIMEASLTFASSNGTPITTATDTIAVAAPAAGSHLQVWRLHASNSSATGVVVSWRDSATGPKLFETYLPQNGVISIKLNGDWDITAATALYISTSAAANVYWTVGYVTPLV